MQNIKNCASLIALTAVGSIFAGESVATTLSFRSQSSNTAAKIMGNTVYDYALYDMESYYGSFWIRPAYYQSFRSGRIAEALFGDALVNSGTGTGCNNSCGDSIVISGTGLDTNGDPLINRGAHDLMAENFYLPRDFQSTISFSPSVKTFLIDFHLYMGLDEWCEGLYFRLYGPFVHTRYNLDFEESVSNAGTAAGNYEPGYFDEFQVTSDELLQSFGAYACGATPGLTNTNLTLQGLKNAKICCGSHSKNGFGDLRFELGYNFLLDEDYHLGLNLQFAAPTGNKPTPEFLFSPQVGNGHHWEFGGGLTSHYTFWRSEDEDQRFDAALEANITHMFGSKVCRTFDLVGKPLSRYMLAARYSDVVTVSDTAPGTETLTLVGDGQPGAAFTFATPAAAVAPSASFDFEYAPVANLSTREVKVTAAVQADITLMFTYVCKGFTWDLGWNLWVRSCENIDFTCGDCNADFPENTWVLKGDASQFGFSDALLPHTPSGTNTYPNGYIEADVVSNTGKEPVIVPLSASDSTATIYVGSNFSSTADPLTNPNIDNANLAYVSPNPDGANDGRVGSGINKPAPADSTATANPADLVNQVNISIDPVFIKQSDLAICSAGTRGLSNKIFTHLEYHWLDCEDWIPYAGVGAEVEFGNGGNSSDSGSGCGDTSTTATNCSSGNGCHKVALSQWGVWVKAGLSFN